MSKLNWLDIANTDVDSGLEYLPISVEKLFCDNNKRSEAKCKKIMDQLNSFRSLDETYGGSYDFRTWKLNEQNRILKDELEQRVSQLEKEVTLLLESTGRLIHNVLLIGKTGNGKSTLANTLTNTNNFKEGKYGVSETRDIQMEVFEENVKEKRIKYRVIDTVGIGDTRLTEREVLYKLAEAAYLVKDGLNQVLFVTSGRFTKEEILAYDLLRKVIFDEKVTDYTTIVRTRFTDFLNKNECQNDIDVIKKENKQLTGVIESCNRIVHVENSLEKREESRSILLEHLAGCQDIYKPQSLKELNSRISNAITKKKQLEKSLIEIQSGKGSNSSTISDYQRQIEKEKENICKETQEHIIKKG
jgi:predicted GTPase